MESPPRQRTWQSSPHTTNPWSLHRPQHLERSDLLEAACDLLWSLAFNNPLLKEVIGQQGGIPIIIRGMKMHPGSTDFLKSACGALSNMCQNAQNQTLIATHGGIFCMVQVTVLVNTPQLYENDVRRCVPLGSSNLNLHRSRPSPSRFEHHQLGKIPWQHNSNFLRTPSTRTLSRLRYVPASFRSLRTTVPIPFFYRLFSTLSHRSSWVTRTTVERCEKEGWQQGVYVVGADC